MVRRSMSDVIEAYLKEILASRSTVEIKRSDIAERFDCVPSQINYVINTRFTQEHGYMVESKRGGGGYIRILKVEVIDDAHALEEMAALIGSAITYRNATTIINTLLEDEIIDQREAILMFSMIDPEFLSGLSTQEDELRAMLLKQMLMQLRYIY
ncbi:CtsR family transcriptional regulator [Falseniella ignava]|uniref:Transcriptional regulator CtsR n=1 Tax=Falseniella ignava TaxID=137730 RepID=A0A2I1JWB6_9LACT|nr:CtsR family transcriptional regulator [Falseniella ignava]PKY87667.1 CtsR family transcriptional regulator [Falseniella ignava]